MAERKGKITEETISYLIGLFSEMCHGEGGDSYLVIDGRTYYTDWGYGIDGIAYFLDIISRRNGLGAFDCRRIDYEEDEQWKNLNRARFAVQFRPKTPTIIGMR